MFQPVKAEVVERRKPISFKRGEHVQTACWKSFGVGDVIGQITSDRNGEQKRKVKTPAPNLVHLTNQHQVGVNASMTVTERCRNEDG